MPHENVEIVRQMYDAYYSGDAEVALELLGQNASHPAGLIHGRKPT
jgi:ketosteroid isomerase-like protein